MNIYDIENKIEKLPIHIIQEVNDYIDFLLIKYGSEEIIKEKFKFDWEGGLSKLSNKFTSIELQHRALDWR